MASMWKAFRSGSVSTEQPPPGMHVFTDANGPETEEKDQ